MCQSLEIDLLRYRETPMKKIIYPVNERGLRIGEHHQRAKLSDEQVELIRDLYEMGEGGYKMLARMFGVSRSTIRDIVQFRRRASTPDRFRTELLDTTAVKPPKPPSAKPGAERRAKKSPVKRG